MKGVLIYKTNYKLVFDKRDRIVLSFDEFGNLTFVGSLEETLSKPFPTLTSLERNICLSKLFFFFCILSFDLDEDLIDFFDCVERYKNVEEGVYLLYSRLITILSFV